MNESSKNPVNVQELVEEIQEFIKNKREPDKIVKAHVREISTKDNTITLELEENFNFYQGAMVTLNKISGIVQDKYSNILKVTTKEKMKLEEGNIVKIDSSLMNLIIARLEKTIDRIENNTLDKNNKTTLQFILGNGEPLYHHKNIIFQSKTLNNSQKEAVNRTLNADNFHLVIGPPGTGKTYVITEILNQLLLKRKKILVTAWTNIAVDNILEKFQSYPADKILRLGSFNEVNPNNRKFTLEEKRKKSKDWKELQELNKLISNQSKSIRKLNEHLEPIKKEINDLNNKIRRYKKDITDKRLTTKKYIKKSSKYKPTRSKLIYQIADLEDKWIKLSGKSVEYSTLAGKLLNLEEWDESLPEAEEFYQLERDIKDSKSKSFIKKITSPLKREEYNKYQEELLKNEEKYSKISEAYNDYWNERDKVEEEYIKYYGDDYGYPQKDSLKIELELVRLLVKYLPLKKAAVEKEFSSSYELIYEAYQQYLRSLDKKVDIIKEKIKFLDEDMRLKTRKHNMILDDIKSLQDLVEINKGNMKNLLALIDDEIVSNSNIIVATVISSAHPVLEEYQFQWVVMDEASQVASFMSLIPLLKTERFVLVGDDKQLQPIEESKLSTHLNLSIFNRLIEQFPDNATFLDTQYRMNETISNIASELFYDGQLKTFPEISQQTLDCSFTADAHELLNPETPVTFLDTCNIEYLEDGLGSGCENSKEAELVVKLVNMLQDQGISSEDIGVITPYKRHKINIQNKLKEKIIGDWVNVELDGDEIAEDETNDLIKDLNEIKVENSLDLSDNYDKVEVDTVYRFQGREKDVIILSFCNSKLGRLKPYLRKFLGKSSQVNVAVTRARKKLILVGNSKNLKESKLLWNLIHLIGKENTVKFSDDKLNN